MTQKDLACATQLSLQYISEVERGIANPKLGTLLQIAEGLKVAPLELFYMDDLTHSGSAQRERLASAILTLDDAVLSSLMRLFLSILSHAEIRRN